MDSSAIIQIVDEEEQKELREEFGIELIEKIDEGSFGVVFKGRDLSDGTLCAVKVTQNNKEKYTSIETSILRQLAHPNIVKFKKFLELDYNKYIVMDYIGCGTLFQLIEERKAQNKPFTENEISTIMNHLVSALKCMHENNVLHRDIKPENILLGSKEDLSLLKLSDFGLSVKYQDGVPFKSYSQKCGTVIFMAPEILAEKQYSKPVDIWSCGVILYMLFTMGKHPFKSSGESRDDYVKKLINVDVSKEEFDEDAFPSELAKDLFMRMLNKEPSNRYTASQVLKHPFITRKLNSNIPLSFQESARVFQNERKLSQTLKAILLLKYIQSKSIKIAEHSAKPTPTRNNKCTPVKYKTYDEKDSPSTERSSLFGNRKFPLQEQNGTEDSLNKEYLQIDSTPNLDDKRFEDSPARHFRINSNKIGDPNKSILSEKFSSHQTLKLKLAIPVQEQKQNKGLTVKSQTNSPIQPNSAQSKDGQSPQLSSKANYQTLTTQQSNQSTGSQNNNFSKFYSESPSSASQKGTILPSINKGQNNSSASQTPLFFNKKDNSTNQFTAVFSPSQGKNTPTSQKLSSHGQRAQRTNQQQPNQTPQAFTPMKTNSLQRPIQTPSNSSNSTTNLQNTNKQLRKSSQNFQIKLITNPHNTSQNSINGIGNTSVVNTSAGTGGPQSDTTKSRSDKQFSFHKGNSQQQQRDSVTPNSNWNNKQQTSKLIPKSNSQTTLSSQESRPSTRQKEMYKPSQFSQQGIKDYDIVSPQKSASQQFSFQSFPHNQRVLTESRKAVHKDSFEYLECEENI